MIGIPMSAAGADNDLNKVFLQVKTEISSEVFKRSADLKMTIQLLTRIVPQTYGGTQKGIETATGQEQALRVAMGVLWGDWDMIRQETAHASNLSVDCFAQNAVDDVYDVIQDDDNPDAKRNEPIRLADLAGKAHAHPEADQAYPMGFEQQRDLFMKMIEFVLQRGKENPILMEILNNYQNRRQMLRYLGPPDMQLPEEDARRWVQKDIAKLIEEAPKQGLNPVTQQPVMECSVIPNADLLHDYWDEAVEVAVIYGLKNGETLLEDSPQGFDNLMLYLEKLRMMQQIQNAPPPGMPPPGGGAGGAGNPASGADAPGAPDAPQLPAGAPTPGPAPPVPGAGPAPMGIQ
jgi:hypothetical protein